jgi:hypothetical protein
MLEGVEKTVLRFPLTSFPKPFYFPGHRTAHRLMPRLLALEAGGGTVHAPGVVLAAMRG